MRATTACADRKFCSMNCDRPAAMRALLRGMTAVCGMKRKLSGWRNSALTANQSAMIGASAVALT
jgi:hypothetical protein